MKVNYHAVQITLLEVEVKPQLSKYCGNVACREVSLQYTLFKYVFKICIHYIIPVLKVSF